MNAYEGHIRVKSGLLTKKTFFVVLIICMLLSIHQGVISKSVAAPLAGTIYFVNGMNGSDSNPGTETQPWKTIQKCLDQVRPGYTCEIFGGTYNESLTLRISGTPSDIITLKNRSGQTVIVNSGNSMTLTTNGRIHYYTIDGLHFISTQTASGQSDFSINLQGTTWDGETTKDGGNNGFIIRDCYIEGAIRLYGHDNLVENCELNGKNNWFNGIQDRFAVSYNNTYRQNIVHDYKVRGIWTMQYTENVIIEANTVYNNGEMGIDCDGAAHPVTQCLVRNNIIDDISGQGLGILLENAFDSIVDANKIYNVEEGIKSLNYGPDISTVEYRTTDTHIIIRNNLIYNASKNGIICYASPGGKALNNTVYNTQISAIRLARYEGYYCHNWEIKNNLISQAKQYALWYVGPSGGLTNLSSDYDLFDFNPSESKLIWEIYTSTSRIWNQYTLAQMKSQRQLELHSISANPLFLNASNQDFRLQYSSPAINKGVNVGLSTDFDGNLRPQGLGYDIGAFEVVILPELIKSWLPLVLR